MDKLRQWMYYFLIGIISMIALCFLPMIGSDVGLGWNLPNTVVGWIVWVTVKLIVAVLNVLIFHCFMSQAKINIKDNEKYQEALEILRKIEDKEYIPRDPVSWNKEQYGKKGTTIFITTALSTIALTQAILQFDWMSMLTYLFTIIMGLIFGVLQMRSAEDYWTDEFWQYAKMVQGKMEVAKKEHLHEGDDTTSSNSRSDILDSSMGTCTTSDSIQSVVVDSNFSEYRFLGRAVHAGCTTSDNTNIIHSEAI